MVRSKTSTSPVRIYFPLTFTSFVVSGTNLPSSVGRKRISVFTSITILPSAFASSSFKFRRSSQLRTSPAATRMMSSFDRVAAPTPAETARRTKSPMPPSRSRSPPGDVASSSPVTVVASSSPPSSGGLRLPASSALRRRLRRSRKNAIVGTVAAGRSRLLTAYFVTAQVALSYLGLSLSKRFRGAESCERLTEAKHRKNARRIEAAILRLRGLFIKVGQLISIMANFLPDAFREELERLQDQVPPRPYSDIEARVREEFGGRGPRELFAEFSPEPVASASIGQVHRARLPSGEEVAVKVQYPDIEEMVRIDLQALRRIFKVLRWFMPDYGFDTIYREISEMVVAELDFKPEAAALQKIAANFAARQPPMPQVRFPRVMAEFSTSRVLTTEWMEGIKVADLERLESLKIDRRAAARLCVEAYCQQIFIDGLYHADPHPGNLLVLTPAQPGGPPTIVFLDFGAVATVSEAMRRGMMSFIQGA